MAEREAMDSYGAEPGPGIARGNASASPRKLVALLAAALFLVACTGEGLKYETRSDTTDRLLALSRQGPQGTTHALRDYARFDWDEVFYFRSGTLHAEMEEVIGAPVLDDPEKRYIGIGPLLVFVKDGTPARALLIAPPLFIGGRTRRGYTRQMATLVARTEDPGPYLLAFVD